jgi:hypothetical protein
VSGYKASYVVRLKSDTEGDPHGASLAKVLQNAIFGVHVSAGGGSARFERDRAFNLKFSRRQFCMARRDLSPKSDAAVSALGAQRRVVAVVVGIENYQTPSSGRGLPKVDFAQNDAAEFANTLKMICAEDQLDLVLLKDSDATLSSLNYNLLQTINSLQSEDVFVFYYAGHGFHGVGGNRITAWDSHPFNIEGSTLLLRDALIERLENSNCDHALAFIDACASGFERLVRGRDVVTSMDADELNAFLASAAYRAMFLSCKPGQKSFPSAKHKHGVWTYFLLRAPRGEA